MFVRFHGDHGRLAVGCDFDDGGTFPIWWAYGIFYCFCRSCVVLPLRLYAGVFIRDRYTGSERIRGMILLIACSEYVLCVRSLLVIEQLLVR